MKSDGDALREEYSSSKKKINNSNCSHNYKKIYNNINPNNPDPHGPRPHQATTYTCPRSPSPRIRFVRAPPPASQPRQSKTPSKIRLYLGSRLRRRPTVLHQVPRPSPVKSAQQVFPPPSLPRLLCETEFTNFLKLFGYPMPTAQQFLTFLRKLLATLVLLLDPPLGFWIWRHGGSG